MGMQKTCPSCNRSIYINTVDGNAPPMVRCQTCGFQMHIPQQKYKLKSSDFGV